MKNINRFFLMITLMFIITSCSNVEDFDVTIQKGGKLTFVAESPGIETSRVDVVGYDPNTLEPVWSRQDYITLVNDRGEEYGFVSNNTENSKTAVFSLGNNENLQNVMSSKKMVAYDFKEYSIEGWDPAPQIVYNKEEETILFKTKSNIEASTNAIRDFFGYDFIVSNQINMESIKDFSQPINLRFKRFSSLIRLNFIDKTHDKCFEDNDIWSLSLDTNNPEDNFTGELIVDTKTGNYRKGSQSSITFTTKDYAGFKNTSKIFYIWTHPVNIVKGGTLTITMRLTNGLYLVKNINIQDKDVKFADGTITTLNISVNDYDIVESPVTDKGVDYQKVYFDDYKKAVICKEPGNLTTQELERFWSYSEQGSHELSRILKINGNINAHDLNSILNLLYCRCCDNDMRGMVDLDLTDANIIGGDGSYYVNDKCEKEQIPQNDVMPKSLFKNVSINSLKLPKSLKRLESEFNDLLNDPNEGIGSLTIQKNTERVDGMEVCIINKLIVLCTPETRFSYTSIMARSADLILNKEWANSPELDLANKRWLGQDFNSITLVYVDYDGNYNL